MVLNNTTCRKWRKNGVKGGVKDGIKELSDIQEAIVKEMLFDPSVTTSEMAQKTVSIR